MILGKMFEAFIDIVVGCVSVCSRGLVNDGVVQCIRRCGEKERERDEEPAV